MSETGGERTERATPKRRQDAREKGQVRKSTEIVVSVSLLIMFSTLKLLSGFIAQKGRSVMVYFLSGSAMTDCMTQPYVFSMESYTHILTGAVGQFFLIALPLMAVALVVGVAGNVAQFGFLFSTKALAPKFSKLNPLQGLKRLFSSRTLFELGKSVLKVVLIIILVQSAFSRYMEDFPAMMRADLGGAMARAIDMVLLVGIQLSAALLILSVFDYAYQWWRYEKDLRMSKYEIKMEYKQQEGDPQIKGKIRQKQRQMAMMRMMQAVPEADVVITNPTHFAVALKYDPDGDRAPKVVAKGQDFQAQRIKRIAREAGVEIVENKPIAQALYHLCEIGMEIPADLYGAVADILAYVYRVKNRLGERR